MTVPIAHHPDVLEIYRKDQVITVGMPGDVFRAENPDAFHFQEFFQYEFDRFTKNVNVVDIWDIFRYAMDVLRNLEINDYTIRINDRIIVWFIADQYNQDHTSFQNWLDNSDKSTYDPYADRASTLCTNLHGKFGCLHEQVQTLIRFIYGGSSIIDNLTNLCTAYQNTQLEPVFSQMLSLLRDYGLPTDRFVIDPALARGANYYNGMIFEIMTPETRGAAIFGGGVFSIKHCEAEEMINGVGGAFGTERLTMALSPVVSSRFVPKTVSVLSDDPSVLVSVAEAVRNDGISIQFGKPLNRPGSPIPQCTSLTINRLKTQTNRRNIPPDQINSNPYQYVITVKLVLTNKDAVNKNAANLVRWVGGM
jgi:histidyl-tRNA synthetase